MTKSGRGDFQFGILPRIFFKLSVVISIFSCFLTLTSLHKSCNHFASFLWSADYNKIINILLHNVPIDAGRLRGYSPKSFDLFRKPFFSYLNVEFYPTLFCTSVPTMLIFESIMIIALKEPQTISIY